VWGRVDLKAEIARNDEISLLSKYPSDDLPILKCLLVGYRGFIYKREVKNGSPKISELSEEAN